MENSPLDFQVPSGTFNEQSLYELCKWAHATDASDIFITTGNPLYVKQSGTMKPLGSRYIRASEVIDVLKDIYQASGPDTLQRGMDINFAHSIMLKDDTQLRFRVNATGIMNGMGREGISIVLRTFPGIAPTPAELKIEAQIMGLMDCRDGIMWVTGPTNSGKSTLFASVLTHRIQHHYENILTFEDPVEFDFSLVPDRKSLVTQSAIPYHLRDYEYAAPNALRRSPDKVMFAETRHRTTLKRVIEVGQTGHFVMTTAHTNSAAETINRLLDLIEVDELSSIASKIISSTRGIVHQRLLKKPGGIGRTAVRECIVFTNDMNDAMEDMARDTTRIRPHVQKLVNEVGMPFRTDLNAKFLDGEVDVKDFIDFTRMFGKPEDLEQIGDVAHTLHQKDAIDSTELTRWLTLAGKRGN